MDWGDLKFGLFISGCVAGAAGFIIGMVFVIIKVAKFAWDS